MAKGKKTGGRKRGSQNKVTRTLKEAIAHVVYSTKDECRGWLLAVAKGEKESEPVLDDDGNPVLDENGDPKLEWSWLRRPEPGAALKHWVDFAEFIEPKLARTILAGDPNAPIPVKATVEFVGARRPDDKSKVP